MHIDKDLHKIGSDNRYKTITKKSQIVIALSLRKDDYHITRLRHKDYGESKKWCTYSVTRFGDVCEHYDPKFYSDYLGVKEVDKKSISIVLENMGSLVKTPDGKYINWVSEVCPVKRVEEKKWLGHQYWEKFSREQIESTVELCAVLCEAFNIEKNVIGFHYPHKEMSKFQGILLKSNYFDDSNSINPLFDLVKFSDLLKLKI